MIVHPPAFVFSVLFHQALMGLLVFVWLFQGALEEGRKDLLNMTLVELVNLEARG